MTTEQAMPVAPGSEMTLDSMSKDECVQLLRNILGAVVSKFPNHRVSVSSSELVRAELGDFKLTIRPTDDGRYIEDVKVEAVLK